MSAASIPRRVRASHFAALLAIGCLIGRYGLGWLLGERGPSEALALISLALATTPLLALLPSFLRGSPRAALALALLALVYMALGVANLSAPETRRTGAFETLFAVALFVATTLFARWRGVSLAGSSRD